MLLLFKKHPVDNEESGHLHGLLFRFLEIIRPNPSSATEFLITQVYTSELAFFESITASKNTKDINALHLCLAFVGDKGLEPLTYPV